MVKQSQQSTHLVYYGPQVSLRQVCTCCRAWMVRRRRHGDAHQVQLLSLQKPQQRHGRLLELVGWTANRRQLQIYIVVMHCPCSTREDEWGNPLCKWEAWRADAWDGFECYFKRALLCFCFDQPISCTLVASMEATIGGVWWKHSSLIMITCI